MIKRFLQCNRGAIAVMTAVVFTALIGMAALGIEVSSWFEVRGSMQGAADAAAVEAALSYAAGNTSGYVNRALAAAGANGWANSSGAVGQQVTVSVNTPPIFGNYTASSYQDLDFEVVISRPEPVFLAWMVGFVTGPTLKVHAVASITTLPGNGCVLALNTSTTNTSGGKKGNVTAPIYVEGGAGITANACGIDSDGTIYSSESSATLTAPSFIYNTTSAGSFNPCTTAGDAYCSAPSGNPTYKNTKTSDPYAGSSFVTPAATPASCIAFPSTANATFSPASPNCYQAVSIGKSQCSTNCTFTSGTYFSGKGSTAFTVGNANILTFGTSTGPNVFYFDGGLSIGGNSEVKFNPGVYYIEGRTFSVAAGTTVTGTGVTIVLTKDSTGAGSPEYATATITGGATFSLSAPTSNLVISGLGTEDTSGIVIFQDRNAPLDTYNGQNLAVSFSGGGNAGTLTGAIYAPQETVSISGGASLGANTTCLQVVAQYITVDNGGAFANGCTGDGTASIGTGTSSANGLVE